MVLMRDCQQVTPVAELGLLTSSLDGTIKICDAARAQVLHTVKIHASGVHCFAYSRAFGVVASGGLERTIRLWQVHASSCRICSHAGAAAL